MLIPGHHRALRPFVAAPLPAGGPGQKNEAGRDAGTAGAPRIIRAFFDSRERSMEAERLNLIETNLADLARRAEELRGYL
jgi:hypothetical protein